MERGDLVAQFVIFAATVTGAVLASIAAVRIQLRSATSNARRLERSVEEARGVLGALDPLRWGRLLLRMRDFEGARDLATAQLEADPNDVDARFLRGQVFAEQRNTQGALSDLRAAATIAPERSDIQMALALSEDAGGSADRVERAVRAAIANSEEGFNLAMAYTLLGDALQRQGKFVEALTAYSSCLDVHPRHSPAVDGRGRTLLRMAQRGERDFAEAIDWYTDYVEDKTRTPDAANTWVHRAIAYLSRGDPGDRDRAERDLEQAKKLTGNTLPLEAGGAMLVETAEAEEDDDLRTELFERALAMYELGHSKASWSYQPVFKNHISYVCQSLGDADRAVAEAEESVLRSPQYPANQMTLACAFMAFARWEDSIKHCSTWLASDAAKDSLPTRIWMRAFHGLAQVCAKAPNEEIRDGMGALLADFISMPEFQPRRRWLPSKTAVVQAAAIDGWSARAAAVVIGLIEGDLSPSHFRTFWSL